MKHATKQSFVKTNIRKRKKYSFWDIAQYAIKSEDPKASQKIDQCVYNLRSKYEQKSINYPN